MATMMASISPPHISPETNPSLSLFENCQSMNHLKQIHSQSIRRGLAYNPIVNSKIIAYCCALWFDSNLFVQNALICMYSLCGQIDIAPGVFDMSSKNDAVTWNAMISGYNRSKNFDESRKLFNAMENKGVVPTSVTLVWVASACSKLKDLDTGIILWGNGSGTRDISEYEKETHNIVDWDCDKGKEALDMLSYMLKASITPDEVTYIGVLCACTNTGMVDDGRKFFSSMMTEHGIEPNVVHYGCMVDLLAKQLLQLEPENRAMHVLLSNIYAACNRRENLRGVRKMMMDRGIKKTPGCSLIEMNGIVHEFVTGDHSHPQSEEIYSKLDEMIEDLKISRYLPNTLEVSLNIGEEEKENVLNRHSEKLAIAFGLISSEPGVTIRIVKNLRMCVDCYLVATLVSRIYNREVIVRDVTLFHHFRNGSCCCKDYW
ncbi:Pentatricopeptide repeat-containing protein [Actinidia chinensis var. chinensis]|uniref:Pentatricopeptide repeat-containing protein n=1 Tax=Actinidia chinensis var. chinensis TaxID=1590841 RepID=A0A2R6QZL1_ACTCC|nr:Pentatricopeptide repeat-containing protein [Actinidia chinensis var. chinensis]